MVLEVMIETEDGSVPKTRDLEDWADTHGLTMPVLADANSEQMWSYASGMSEVGALSQKSGSLGNVIPASRA